jgi:hypothetical protein
VSVNAVVKVSNMKKSSVKKYFSGGFLKNLSKGLAI